MHSATTHMVNIQTSEPATQQQQHEGLATPLIIGKIASNKTEMLSLPYLQQFGATLDEKPVNCQQVHVPCPATLPTSQLLPACNHSEGLLAAFSMMHTDVQVPSARKEGTFWRRHFLNADGKCCCCGWDGSASSIGEYHIRRHVMTPLPGQHRRNFPWNNPPGIQAFFRQATPATTTATRSTAPAQTALEAPIAANTTAPMMAAAASSLVPSTVAAPQPNANARQNLCQGAYHGSKFAEPFCQAYPFAMHVDKTLGFQPNLDGYFFADDCEKWILEGSNV
eukprot:COSAG05_NODE_109_length_18675_cov_6.774279_4_plen_280_part_00